LNNGELLPGGGLVSAAGVLTVTEGVPGGIEFADTNQWKGLWERRGGAYIEPPGPLKRYLLKDFSWNLATSNWSPDFPTWGQQALEFYELVYGPQHVDGVVAMDLTVLEGLLGVTGARTLETANYGRVTFSEDNAVLELERVTRRPFDAVAVSDRKSVIGDLAELLLDEVLDLPSNRWDELADTVLRLGGDRHIQVLMLDAAEQTLVRDIGWSGDLQRPPGDYLHFNEANLNGTKLNLIIQPEAVYRIDVTELGDARHELRLSYRNTLPEWQAGKDPQFVRKLMLGGLYGGYLRVFVPEGAVQFSALLDGAPAAIEDVGTEGAKTWFGVFMSLPAGEEREVVLRWTVPLATVSPGVGEYQLYIQKQPGTAGMCMAITVQRAGMAAKELRLDGGARDGAGRICLTEDVVLHARF
jgi:hypothetical protein